MIVITRPKDQAIETAKEIENLGLQALVEPLLDVRPLPYEMPDLNAYQGIIFTSANSVKYYTGEYDCPCFVVGEKTAERIKRTIEAKPHLSGRDHLLHEAAKNVEDLQQRIENTIEDNALPLLYVRGVDIAIDLKQNLELKDIIVEDLIVYDASLIKQLSDEFVAGVKEQKITAITVFSKRTALNLVRLIERYKLQKQLSTINVLSISESVLECVHSLKWKGTYASENPDLKSMLALIKSVCA